MPRATTAAGAIRCGFCFSSVVKCLESERRCCAACRCARADVAPEAAPLLRAPFDGEPGGEPIHGPRCRPPCPDCERVDAWRLAQSTKRAGAVETTGEGR